MGALRDLIQEIISQETNCEDGLAKFKDIIKVYPSNRTQYEKYNYVRCQLKKHLGNKEVDLFFKPPEKLLEAVKQENEDKERKRLNEKLVVDFTLVMNAAIKGLHLGIQHKIYPQVLFCLSCLVCTRPNDMNGKHKRTNGQVFSPETTILHEKDGVLSLIKLKPSKQKNGTDYPPEITPFLCDTEHYDLCKEAFQFLQDEENIERDCYSSYDKYQRNEPCGPCTQACQWRKSGRTVPDLYECMCLKLGFDTAVIESSGFEDKMGREKKFRWRPYDARRFSASAFEDGRCSYGYGTRKKRKHTVNSVLGHVSNTNADEQYLTMQLDNMPVLEDLSLKLAEFHPYEVDDDLTITKGCYLIAK